MEKTIFVSGDNPKQGKEAQESNCCPEIDRRLRWNWVEPMIWTDKMLAALENGVKGNKWFSLIDKVCKPLVLYGAWEKVKGNQGAGGVDKMTIEKFQENEIKYLKEIEEELKSNSYKPKPVKRVYIPKGGGKMRPLGIPAVKDRVVQQAVKMALEPIFEKEFLNMSFGFRPGKGAKEALKEVSDLITEGYTWVVDADLQSYFDTIPHDKLMDKVSKRVSDGKVLGLIEGWLEQEIMEEGKTWTPTQGTPQGGVLSPLLANIYLHDLDVKITEHGYRMIRYADDFVILTKSNKEAEEALRLVKEWVTPNGLSLHPDKTHVGNCMIEGQGFEFLGYRFEAGKTWIRKKSIKSFRDRIREKTRRTCGRAITDVIASLNPVLRGWSEYFKEVTKYTLGTFDSFVRRRLRAILKIQNKQSGFGVGWCNTRWPNKFFAELGLFTMEVHQALGRARQSRCGNDRLESRMR